MTSHSDEQKLRSETMENDRKVREQGSTFLDFARSSINDESGGRFARSQPQTIVGSTPGPSYPMLPASSPWHGSDPVPDEPPLGFAVDALEPAMGSFFSPVEAQAGGPTPAAPPLVRHDVSRGVGPPSFDEEEGSNNAA
jgi:hypothetical protein